MARYEVAVRTDLVFPRRTEVGDGDADGPSVIRFGSHDFVWHPCPPSFEDEEVWPTVTVEIPDGQDYGKEARSMEALLSAIAYGSDRAIEVLLTGASGFKAAMDSPLLVATRRGLAGEVRTIPAEVTVAYPDENLRMVLALYREGLNSGSPFYCFLSFWKALEVAFDDKRPPMNRFIDSEAPKLAEPGHEPPASESWHRYLRNSNRNAVAHALRRPNEPVLDPDDPLERGRLRRDARLVSRLLRRRMDQRWPKAIQLGRGEKACVVAPTADDGHDS